MKNDRLNRIQSILLIISMASILGLTGWLIGGFFLAVFAVSLTFFLYFINPLISPVFIAKMHRGHPLHCHEAARFFQVLEELSHFFPRAVSFVIQSSNNIDRRAHD